MHYSRKHLAFVLCFLFSSIFSCEVICELKIAPSKSQISHFNELWAEEMNSAVVNETPPPDTEEGTPIGDLYFFLIFPLGFQTPCGYISYYACSEKRALLDSLFLEKSWRGRGIGECALTQLEVKLKQVGFVTISLSVLKENGAALHLYKKLGYQVTQGFEGGYIMGKSL